MSGTKVKMIRELRGYSQEYVANKLEIGQSSYSRIESNQSKLDSDTINKLAQILDVNPIDIISNEPTVVNFSPNQGTQGIGHIEHFYSSQKDLIDKLIGAKDQEIGTLKEVIQTLIKDKETLMQLLQSKKP